MGDLKNGLDENGLIDFVKTVLLSGNNPRGKEAIENLKWGIKQYRKQLILHGVSNCKTKPKLSKLETELGKLEKVHGDIVKYFDVHSGCDSFKFKDGAVYRVKLERSLGKATLD